MSLLVIGIAASALSACAQGSGGRRDAAVGRDAGAGVDAPFAALDAPFAIVDTGPTPDAVIPATPDAFEPRDAFVAPGTDAFVVPTDAFVAPRPDAFVSPDAASSGCAESPCRILAPQCGCAAGQSCYPSGAMRVCAATGTRLEGNGCTTFSDCAPGLGCVNFSSDAARPGNMCSRVCASDADCASGAICVHTIDDGTGGTVAGLQFCSRACTPAPNTGCAPGLACTLFQERAGLMRIFADCAGPVGTGRQGAGCVDDVDCAAGFACFNTGTGNACLAWCRVASPSCPIGTACVSVGTAGGVEWGACG